AFPDRPLPQSARAPASPAAAAPVHATAAARRRLATSPVPATPPPAVVAPTAPPIAALPTHEPRPMFALSAGTVASGPPLVAPAVVSSGLTARSWTSSAV